MPRELFTWTGTCLLRIPSHATSYTGLEKTTMGKKSAVALLLFTSALSAEQFIFDGVGGVVAAFQNTESRNIALTPVSAALNGGSTIVPLGGDTHRLGDEWQCLSSVKPYHGATQGHFGCPTTCDAVDGFEWGILGSDDGAAGHQGNPGVQGAPLIADSIVFTLAGLPADSDVSGISNVGFQFGTSAIEPSIPGEPGRSGGPGGSPVPEPAMAILIGGGLIVVSQLRRRKN